jgi:hypothetical protein
VKKCGKCKVEKPTTDFHKLGSSADGLQPRCKPCRLADERKRYQGNPHVRLAARESGLRRRYGVSVAQYDAMLAAQGGVCKLCDGVCSGGGVLAVDHNHETGEVRGLLCAVCNTAVERLDSVPGWAERASAYVRPRLRLEVAS